jgi:hypothetical protein
MTNKTVHYKMKEFFGASAAPPGFSLAEVLAALTIGAMIVVAILSIYHRAERSASAAIRRLEASQLPGEVLQSIAEDLDRMISSNTDAKVTIQNKLEAAASGRLIPAARLAITRTIADAKDTEHVFEEIIWQSSYSIESLAEGLVLYRSHGGINLEDKVLQENKYEWERESFVPICSGVTFFNISAVAGNNLVERWDGVPPTGIAVTISFAEPYKNIDGSFDVLEEDKITRTIAIDRTRKIRFDIAGAGKGQGQDPTDANETGLSVGKGSPTGGSSPGKEGASSGIKSVKPTVRRK